MKKKKLRLKQEIKDLLLNEFTVLLFLILMFMICYIFY